MHVKDEAVRGGFGLVVMAGFLLLAGCAGTGEVVNLDVRFKPTDVQPVDTQPLKIVVETFEDKRADKSKLGLRTHLWGGVTYFNVPGGRPGEVAAQALADYLRLRGWKVGVRTPGVTTAEGEPDILLTGQVMEFSANAKSRFFSTAVNTGTRFVIRARNAVDGSTTTMNLDGSRSETVFWFDPEDVQRLLNETLKESLDRLMADTKIENGAWRLK